MKKAILICLVLLYGLRVSRAQSEFPVYIGIHGIKGILHLPEQKGNKFPAIVTLGGSLGGIKLAELYADSLCKHGYISLSLAYFNYDSLPTQLEEIPLEYFKKGLDYLLSHPKVDANRIGILGVSKGAEAALLIGSYFPEIPVAVAAHMPSAYVWQGINWDPKSSWKFNNQPLPFIKYGNGSREDVSQYYINGLSSADSTEITKATIPVENINGPVLISAGALDRIWPSALFSKQIINRLQEHNFQFNIVHNFFPKGGHSLFGLFGNIEQYGYVLSNGGSLENNYNASQLNWKVTLAFFENHLRK